MYIAQFPVIPACFFNYWTPSQHKYKTFTSLLEMNLFEGKRLETAGMENEIRITIFMLGGQRMRQSWAMTVTIREHANNIHYITNLKYIFFGQHQRHEKRHTWCLSACFFHFKNVIVNFLFDCGHGISSTEEIMFERNGK